MELRQHKRPIWFGILLASLAPAVCVSFVGIVSTSRPPPLTQLLSRIGAVFALATPVSLAAMLLLGLPLVLWLRSRNVLNTGYVCAGAALIGAITFGLLSWALSSGDRLPHASMLVVGAVFGVVSGLAFCIGAGTNSSFSRGTLTE